MRSKIILFALDEAMEPQRYAELSLAKLLFASGGRGTPLFFTPAASEKWEFGTSRQGRQMDLVYVALTIGFFALSWGLVKLCERL